MKIVLVLVLECLLFSSFLAQISEAASNLQATEDQAAVSFDVKRDAEYRNSLFGAYICRVMKATERVKANLQVIVVLIATACTRICINYINMQL